MHCTRFALLNISVPYGDFSLHAIFLTVTGIAVVWVLIIPFALLFVWVRACVFVRMTKKAPRPEPVNVEAYASVLETENGHQLSSIPGIMATPLPSAEATILYPRSGAMYHIATAVVATESA